MRASHEPRDPRGTRSSTWLSRRASLAFVIAGAAASAACKEKPPGPQEVIWNGDRKADGGKGWANCDTPPECKADMALADGKGFSGSRGLHFQGAGKGYLGAGWNWFGWWPENSGKDLSPYNMLQFEVRVTVSEPNPPPEDLDLMINLVSSTEKKKSAVVKLSKYVDGTFADGKWHLVNIPLDDFYEGGFDRQKVWEIGVGTWSAAPRKLEVFIDDIAVWER